MNCNCKRKSFDSRRYMNCSCNLQGSSPGPVLGLVRPKSNHGSGPLSVVNIYGEIFLSSIEHNLRLSCLCYLMYKYIWMICFFIFLTNLREHVQCPQNILVHISVALFSMLTLCAREYGFESLSNHSCTMLIARDVRPEGTFSIVF